jgi:anaerobic magnesium-protoporphyrin IX monomethyl ester cyclase
MKVLLTHSYFLARDPKQLHTHKPYPPLATLYAAGHLRKHGFSVRVADLQLASPEKIIEAIDEQAPDLFVIYDDCFNYLNKMCLTAMREAAFEMQALVSARSIPIAVSSSDATDHAEEYLARGANYVLAGEGEQTLLELAQALDESRKPANVDGLIYRQGEDLFRGQARKLFKDLDQLAFPAWDLIDLSQYRKIWMKHHGYFSINLVTTRGCPYKCNWCAKPVYGNRYNSHSPEYVVSMIHEAMRNAAFNHIWFADDIFGLKPGWLRQFAELMKNSGMTIRYKIQSRADLLVKEGAISHLKESGCDEVWIGAESGSQKILDAMDKGTTVEQISDARQLLREHGIHAGFFLQFGYPGETREDIEKTIGLVRKTQPDDIGVSISYPLPGTVFYERVKSDLGNKSNWTNSDELAMMFRNTYPPKFYKTLHRYVHHVYRRDNARLLLGATKFGVNGFRHSAKMFVHGVIARIRKMELDRLAK